MTLFNKDKDGDGQRGSIRCPNCGKKASSSAKFCKGCGYDYELQGRPTVEDSRSSKLQLKRNRQIKLGLAFITVVILLILVIRIILGISWAKGKNTAEDIAGNIGQNIDSLSSIATMYQTSSYACVNDLMEYNWICEDDSSVNVGGLVVPQWVIFCCNNDLKALTKVVLYDFRLLKDDWKGEQLNEKLDTTSLYIGIDYDTADDIIGIEPYKITYTVAGTTYSYRCCWQDLEKNEVCQEIELKCDNFGKVTDWNENEQNFASILLGAEIQD